MYRISLRSVRRTAFSKLRLMIQATVENTQKEKEWTE
jgi:hypothetical protein